MNNPTFPCHDNWSDDFEAYSPNDELLLRYMTAEEKMLYLNGMFLLSCQSGNQTPYGQDHGHSAKTSQLVA
jgi:hypothetical protein